MKMRQFKRAKLAAMTYALFGPWGPIAQWLTPARSYIPAPGEVLHVIDDLSGLANAMALPTISQEVAGGPVVVHDKYIVKRVKDGEVVLATESRTEALMLIEKHARQKKAKLVAFCNDEPVLFGEDETIVA